MTTTHEMSHADAAWLHMDSPANLMVIASALWFDEPIDEEELRAVVTERLVERYPRFRQVAVEGLTGPHWEDDENFDLDLHIHHLALPAPGDQAALQRVVGELVSQPLDRARPLWEMHLLDGYGTGSAVVVRMHHSIADGIALARVMMGLTDDPARSDDEDFVDTPHRRSPMPLEGVVRDATSLTRADVHEATETLLHPSHAAELAREGMADARSLVKFLTAPTERRHALHDEIGIAHRVAWTRPLKLAEIKAAGAREGATINDVLVSCVAGAIRDHLLSQGEAPADVHAMVPFNLRPLDQPLPRDLGNRFGLVLLDIPVQFEDPVVRLHETSERMRAIKESRDGPVAYGILGVIGRAPLALEKPVVEMFASKATMVLTNVPGPRTPVFMTGVRLGGVLVWAPCSGTMGMTVSIFSYDGDVTIGFMVNARLLEDPGVLTAACERRVQELVTGATR
jgi:diacylglycerol O-acyltransferase